MNKTSRKTFQFSVTQKKVSLKEFYRIFGNAALSNGIFEPLKLSEIEDFFAFELPKFVVDSLRASCEFVLSETSKFCKGAPNFMFNHELKILEQKRMTTKTFLQNTAL